MMQDYNKYCTWIYLFVYSCTDKIIIQQYKIFSAYKNIFEFELNKKK